MPACRRTSLAFVACICCWLLQRWIPCNACCSARKSGEVQMCGAEAREAAEGDGISLCCLQLTSTVRDRLRQHDTDWHKAQLRLPAKQTTLLRVWILMVT